jgi:prophage antirepressor-like protein
MQCNFCCNLGFKGGRCFIKLNFYLDDEDKFLKVSLLGETFKNQYFLSINGLYEVLFTTRKPIAKLLMCLILFKRIIYK